MQASHLQINKIANLSLHHGILCLHIVCCCSDRYMEAINQCQIQYCGLVVYTLYCKYNFEEDYFKFVYTKFLFQYDIIDILIISLSVFFARYSYTLQNCFILGRYFQYRLSFASLDFLSQVFIPMQTCFKMFDSVQCIYIHFPVRAFLCTMCRDHAVFVLGPSLTGHSQLWNRRNHWSLREVLELLGVLMSGCSHPGHSRVPPLLGWQGDHEIWMGIVLEATQAFQLSVDPIENPGIL